MHKNPSIKIVRHQTSNAAGLFEQHTNILEELCNKIQKFQCNISYQGDIYRVTCEIKLDQQLFELLKECLLKNLTENEISDGYDTEIIQKAHSGYIRSLTVDVMDLTAANPTIRLLMVDTLANGNETVRFLVESNDTDVTLLCCSGIFHYDELKTDRHLVDKMLDEFRYQLETAVRKGADIK